MKNKNLFFFQLKMKSNISSFKIRKEISKEITSTFTFPKEITQTFTFPKEITQTFIFTKELTPTFLFPKEITPSFTFPKEIEITPSFTFPKELTPTFSFPKKILAEHEPQSTPQNFQTFFPTIKETPYPSFSFQPFTQELKNKCINESQHESESLIENNASYSFLYDVPKKEKESINKSTFSFFEEKDIKLTTQAIKSNTVPEVSFNNHSNNISKIYNTRFNRSLSREKKIISPIIKSQPKLFIMPNLIIENKKILFSQNQLRVKPTNIYRQIFKLVLEDIKKNKRKEKIQISWTNKDLTIFIDNKKVQSGSWVNKTNIGIKFSNMYGTVECCELLNLENIDIDTIIKIEKKNVEFKSDLCNYQGKLIITMKSIKCNIEKAKSICCKNNWNFIDCIPFTFSFIV